MVLRPQSPFLHLAWPGTGLGWHAPGPWFVSRMTFLAPSIDPASPPAEGTGGTSSSRPHVCERSTSASPSSVPLCFSQTHFCHMQREFLKLNKRCPDFGLHVCKAEGSPARLCTGKPRWTGIQLMDIFFFILLFKGGKS